MFQSDPPKDLRAVRVYYSLDKEEVGETKGAAVEFAVEKFEAVEVEVKVA